MHFLASLKILKTDRQKTREPDAHHALTRCNVIKRLVVWWTEERESIPFHPQSAAVVLLNITPVLGTRSGHSPRLAPYRMECDILLFCTMTACEGQACGLGFVKIEHWCWGPSGQSKSPCFTGRTGAAMWRLPVVHLSEQAGGAMGGDLQWGTDLMEEAGCIWQVKTRGHESDARVSRANLSGGGRLKGILTRRTFRCVDHRRSPKRKALKSSSCPQKLGPNHHQLILEVANMQNCGSYTRSCSLHFKSSPILFHYWLF